MNAAVEPPGELAVLPGTTGEGAAMFALLVKRTYDIVPGKACVRSASDRPLQAGDAFYDEGDPDRVPVKFESELVPFKPAVDVVLIGSAYAPGGIPVETMDVSLEIGGARKVIRVIGDRRCIFRGSGAAPGFTDPVPFTAMEIRYDRAYGGRDDRSIPGLPFFYPRNPLGRGLAVKNVAEVVEGLPLPNFEDPQDLLTPGRVVLGAPEAWNAQPLPQGFGWFPKTSYPRCSFAGVIPGFVDSGEPLREEILGLVPRGQVALARRFRLPSFDLRFCNGASPGLAVPALRGDEEVRTSGLSPEGDLSFFLPGDSPRMVLDIGLGERELAPVLQTVCIRLDERRVDLVWRGVHEYPGIDWLPNMTRLNARVS